MLGDIPRHLFANPEFLKNTSNFYQDKVVVIEEYLSQNNLENNKKMVDMYVGFQKNLWSYGVHDDVYKFQPNYGIDAMEKIVCIDFRLLFVILTFVCHQKKKTF